METKKSIHSTLSCQSSVALDFIDNYDSYDISSGMFNPRDVKSSDVPSDYIEIKNQMKLLRCGIGVFRNSSV